ncbi:hypothetical protein BJ973_002489 [Actinoplanes tereljensis]|uniref:Uncharacterized protein n=1 Tax=Paractinoplanes tereljensis TaxID=571912 RepID=A0A919NNK6_9ACTN|nr:hypothetical protein [Actinoplanes tereljensis]GIF22164.1 hypothetical protein Ate02nite_48940 [Actinoplanes tereljensis]
MTTHAFAVGENEEVVETLQRAVTEAGIRHGSVVGTSFVHAYVTAVSAP